MTPMEVPVLIVGGGGAGLTASMLLSKLGVESLLVSALPSTSMLPKAHVLNQRAMEILTDVGVAEEIYRRGTPAENMRHTAYYAGFAGRDPVYGRQIGRLESWGAGGLDTDWASASPCRQANLPQIRLEPILKRGAEALAPGRVRFHHELVDLEQDADGVAAKVLDKDTGAESTIRARYLLACDGGRTVGPRLGVTLAEGGRSPADLLENLQSFYFDTALSGSPAALPSLLAFAKPGHVLFGSDWPYAPTMAVSYFTGQLDAYAALDANGHAAIDRTSAVALFPQF